MVTRWTNLFVCLLLVSCQSYPTVKSSQKTTPTSIQWTIEDPKDIDSTSERLTPGSILQSLAAHLFTLEPNPKVEIFRKVPLTGKWGGSLTDINEFPFHVELNMTIDSLAKSVKGSFSIQSERKTDSLYYVDRAKDSREYVTDCIQYAGDKTFIERLIQYSENPQALDHYSVLGKMDADSIFLAVDSSYYDDLLRKSFPLHFRIKLRGILVRTNDDPKNDWNHLVGEFTDSAFIQRPYFGHIVMRKYRE